jgi:hypothetical protein
MNFIGILLLKFRNWKDKYKAFSTNFTKTIKESFKNKNKFKLDKQTSKII